MDSLALVNQAAELPVPPEGLGLAIGRAVFSVTPGEYGSVWLAEGPSPLLDELDLHPEGWRFSQLRGTDSSILLRDGEAVDIGRPGGISIYDVHGGLQLARMEVEVDRALCEALARDRGISRYHARIETVGEHVVRVTDLGSTNGTHVDPLLSRGPASSSLAHPVRI
jgi:hypothetical protein